MEKKKITYKEKYEDLLKILLIEDPACAIIYNKISIKEIVEIKAEWEIEFISDDFSYITNLIIKGED